MPGLDPACELNAAHVREEDCQIISDLAPRADEYVVD
jgi:hypothetical protein